MKRADALNLIRYAGYHHDHAAYTRLLIENRVSKAAADEAFNAGKRNRANGMRCKCAECQKPTHGVFNRVCAGDPTVTVNDRLFIGVYPCAIVYADRGCERDGDYLRLASLSYKTLVLEWANGIPYGTPQALRDAIEAHARGMQARRGERFPLSTSENVSIVLGE